MRKESATLSNPSAFFELDRPYKKRIANKTKDLCDAKHVGNATQDPEFLMPAARRPPPDKIPFNDRLRAAPDLPDPAPGGSQCVLRCGRILAGQRPRYSHSAVDRRRPHRRSHRSAPPSASG